MPEWAKSRKFLGTIVAVILLIVEANSVIKVPTLAYQLWIGWVASETVIDTASVLRGRTTKKP